MAKIVFCEDEPAIRKVMALLLRLMGHEVHLAADGREGLALIERERPDLIFTDISMPECDGFQLAELLRERPHLANIPLSFVTAFAHQSDLEEGIRHGARGYLFKPFSRASVQAAIEEAQAPENASDEGRQS